MKVYCKRCNVGIRLAVVNEVMGEREVDEMGEMVCGECVNGGDDEFSRSFSRGG